MNYPALRKRMKDGPITVQDMVEFYAEYIECDALGKTLLLYQLLIRHAIEQNHRKDRIYRVYKKR